MSSLFKTNLKRRKNAMKGGKQCSLEESRGEYSMSHLRMDL
jgi:hypothetical protein